MFRILYYFAFAVFWAFTAIVGWRKVPAIYTLAAFGCALCNTAEMVNRITDKLGERD